MTVKVGINGMGRIGRMIVRAIIESSNKNIIIKHINNRTNAEACSTLLKYDSVHGKFNAKLELINTRLLLVRKQI
jgi:glyceraldehyde 3-phosphate dehydrogenase